MAFRIYRRSKAADDAEQIADSIASDSIDSAIRFLANLKETLTQVADAPGIGSPFVSSHPELSGLRSCRVNGFPQHVIFYLEGRNEIEVVRILHGSRDIEAELKKR